MPQGIAEPPAPIGPEEAMGTTTNRWTIDVNPTVVAAAGGEEEEHTIFPTKQVHSVENSARVFFFFALSSENVRI